MIEKGIPLPPEKSERGKWKRLAASMEIGESVRCETYSEQENMRGALYLMGRKASSRKCDGAYRVWRVA